MGMAEREGPEPGELAAIEIEAGLAHPPEKVWRAD